MLKDWIWKVVDKVNYSGEGNRPIAKKDRSLMQKCETSLNNVLMPTFHSPNKLRSMGR